MTNYIVDTTAIFEYRWDETPKYPLVRVLGYTVNPVVVTSTVNRDANDNFTNRLSTLSRPPPKAVFVWARRSHPQVFGERRASGLSTLIHIFLTEKIRSVHFVKMPKSYKIFCAKRRNAQKGIDFFLIL